MVPVARSPTAPTSCSRAVRATSPTARCAETRRSAGTSARRPAATRSAATWAAPLIALGARVRSTGAGGERTEPIEDFLAGDRAGRLVLEVDYDRFERRTGASGLRRRHAHSYAIAGVVACSRADGADLRVAVTGAGPTAVRCRAVEASRDAADVLKDVAAVDDAVASAAYRSAVLPQLVREALDDLERA